MPENVTNSQARTVHMDFLAQKYPFLVPKCFFLSKKLTLYIFWVYFVLYWLISAKKCWYHQNALKPFSHTKTLLHFFPFCLHSVWTELNITDKACQSFCHSANNFFIFPINFTICWMHSSKQLMIWSNCSSTAINNNNNWCNFYTSFARNPLNYNNNNNQSIPLMHHFSYGI